ncbi:hypothetical protein EI94DRAFT_1700533 [Lactarius quietus]|nr:hypothetical protein EI94DRAFT_1700533 [Lactarius quietus]
MQGNPMKRAQTTVNIVKVIPFLREDDDLKNQSIVKGKRQFPSSDRDDSVDKGKGKQVQAKFRCTWSFYPLDMVTTIILLPNFKAEAMISMLLSSIDVAVRLPTKFSESLEIESIAALTEAFMGGIRQFQASQALPTARLPGANKLMLTSQHPNVHAIIQEAIKNIQEALLFNNAFPDVCFSIGVMSLQRPELLNMSPRLKFRGSRIQGCRDIRTQVWGRVVWGRMGKKYYSRSRD